MNVRDSQTSADAETGAEKVNVMGTENYSETGQANDCNASNEQHGNVKQTATTDEGQSSKNEAANDTSVTPSQPKDEEEDLGDYFRKLVQEYSGKPMMKKALLNEFNSSGLRDRLKMITELEGLIDDQTSDQEDLMHEANQQYTRTQRKHQQQHHQQHRQHSQKQHRRSSESKESVRGSYASIDSDDLYSSDESDAESFTASKQHARKQQHQKHKQSSNKKSDAYPLGTSTLGLLDVDPESLDADAVDEAWVELLNETLSPDKRKVLMEQYQREKSPRARYHMLLEFTSYLRQPQQKSTMPQSDTPTNDANDDAGMGMRRRNQGNSSGETGGGLPGQTQSKDPMDLREMFGDLSSAKGGKQNNNAQAASRAHHREGGGGWCCEGFGMPLPGMAMVAIVGLAVFRVVSQEIDVFEFFTSDAE